ncbi:hypothetical protein EV356DRAFT_514112 [Viridothelium virens]|uniref:Uncharacterized protein n=1 Tax=Viridothelium virens TaxID=1048519 RepID=A0A6A6HBV5_VIRVR|nr:hypothetical protein EV356DRAFT_514112 [Viridothelium virens]
MVQSQLGLATPDHAHISALHHQTARGREVVVVMNPNLHLVWYYDRIFIQPIPRYLLSEAFWKFLQRQDKALWQACAGFIRTYWYLIKYEIDFQKALDPALGLIPVVDKQNPMTFEEFVQFVRPFTKLGDDCVSKRFTFGELRLSRLNILARIFLGKMTYHHIHAQWNEYLGKFLAPFIALFALLSAVLSAMQVGLATAVVTTESGSWHFFSTVSRWFAVVIIILVLLALISYLVLVIIMMVHDFYFAKKMEQRKRIPGFKHKISEMRSGVV